ncbi:hypothetical protein CIPAW_01G083500 [Carya illinoinensis]|uniref:DUF7731 domain-containing protein n=1 Tax=Carya illinoinensis TaxID=32201 RepID=A0A8T1RK27_CARIL|nr:hypothetical protein CIPAW_01G083500 [Carya illinoinensis]
MHACLLSNKIEPRSNVNLGPIQGWRSAYFCIMYNKLASCLEKDQLTDTGVVNVSKEEIEEYCKKGGCREHIGYVLKCIHDVKRDFWFANNITVRLLNESISDGCAKNEDQLGSIFVLFSGRMELEALQPNNEMEKKKKSNINKSGS